MLTILRAGPLSSVQDGGRSGFRALGVCAGGGLDPLSLQLANRLVGNPAGAAVIEITLGPFEVRFGRAGVLALTGANMGARLDGVPVWPGWRTPFSAGQVLRLGSAADAMRTYLAIDGGVACPVVLGARSTDLAGGFGGHEGRALRAGDVLPLGPAGPVLPRLGVRLPDWDPYVRLLPGPEYDAFDAEARDRLWREEWTVTPQSNRMGCRLSGKPLRRRGEGDLLSHAVVPGIVQVPPSGQPIILMADAQTTGGYPRIAVVIEADRWKVAQTRLGSRLRFVACDAATAARAWQAQQRYLDKVEAGLDGH